MPIQVFCSNPRCGASYSISDDLAGREGRCKHCGQAFELPRREAEHRPTGSPRPVAEPVNPLSKVPKDSPARGPVRWNPHRTCRSSSAGIGSSSDWARAGWVGLPGPGHPARPPGGPEGPALHSGRRRPRSCERFYREARAAATLDHPNLCPVYDVGEIDGVQFLTMAYIEGSRSPT